ncbi:MAG: hypothetical protein A3A80_03045 [Candidatus Terrybacteria bacterium RIFCSPLOWO2_01_FULL_44_24]|uniref:Uncharacterized protein n=1 Tax=Candidatus Terrybacteria bacterium RIFCSPHIGHO2_01_FULL_43_35 TaxID=1802361 RepID=A0A1G2PEL7_9BACT|nr:MAG: hypothetical protein A2828_00600 [Candidatus Terrybacteria bacterium RIFCSPHIGHO2_01_FULL_43_35]OHA49407.1 MAG: hypothetical protein A3B75_02830 [Candidatus Terrybacteria bacterium RIFCSPHIGHO2_02_FULL_43_14]OHA51631.1 MAG: hypothetical protein A3A80_03045 [Candidatus Terrybacteria bacterium RIFCSPLOWO2_01_FULL_44_24]
MRRLKNFRTKEGQYGTNLAAAGAYVSGSNTSERSSKVGQVLCNHTQSQRRPVPYVHSDEGHTLIFKTRNPDIQRHFFVEIDSFTKGEAEDFEIAIVDNCRACFENILGKLDTSPEEVKDFFTVTNMGPVGWPGPIGCVHYLKTLYPSLESALEWLAYAYDYDGHREEFKRIRTLMLVEYEKIEMRPATISIQGGYCDLVDGSRHYCSAKCALADNHPGYTQLSTFVEKELARVLSN